MQFTAGRRGEISSAMIQGLAKYRHKVFVEMLGWDLQTEDNLELDEFDRDDTMYVVAQDDNNEITGCLRLLPTTKPYLLGEVFPDLMGDTPLPQSPEVWELSRFAAMDFNAPKMNSANGISSTIAVGLLQQALSAAAQLGAKKVITVSPVGIERLLRFAGFKTCKAGRSMVIRGHALTANWIDC